MVRVSVPSRGILFPNKVLMQISQYLLKHRFRPLSGYLISKSVIDGKRLFVYWVSVPSRGILFPNISRKTTHSTITRREVSVPSRGILFPNVYYRFIKGLLNHVSVPSRGILFPNYYNQKRGDMKCQAQSFRPLSGYLISK